MPQRNPSSKLTQRQAKGKGSGNPRNPGRGTGCQSPAFLCTEEVGTPKASLNWGKTLYFQTLILIFVLFYLILNEPCATPIKSIFSLLKAGKLKASWKKAKGKLKASERQAKNKLKGN